MKRFLSLFISALCAVGAWAQNTHNGHEYVDLGLSVKWATCNVGANTPQSAGDYYSWGETETLYEAGSDMENPTWKEGYSAGYDYSSYQYMDHSKDTDWGYTKYTVDDDASDGVWYNSEGEFIGDGKEELEDVDDVAVQKWGGRWSMPTVEQQLELYYGCYWVWTNTYNGESVNGYIVYKAKKDEDHGVHVSEYGTPSSDYDVATDAHIFLPATGFFCEAQLKLKDQFAYYWTQSLYPRDSHVAFCVGFDFSDVARGKLHERIYGCPVRPVYEPTPIAQIGETIYTDVDAFITAFEAIEDKATVQLLDDITLSDEKEFNNENSGADITFDLNGHNITNNSDYCTTFRIKDSKLTIAGQGVVEVTSELSSVFVSNGTMVINSGTYKSKSAICFVYLTANLIIKGGKFNAAAVYKDDGDFAIKPIVKGGLFSMDPSACVADGSEMVDNDDEETKDEYLYKVVALPIAQIGETIYTDVDAFIKAFEAIEGNATVQLLGDIILPEDDFLGNKNENANITLDLNGHNITGNRYYNAVIFAVYCNLTISGEGVVENTGEKGEVVGCEGYVEINGGTYIGTADICYVDGVMIINGGKFNAPKLYYNDDDYYAPTVNGGLFSMDPTDGVAVGYEAVENDDEETKDVYPYMVVESDVDLTNPAGLLAVPQAGELNIRAYFTAMPGIPYMYALIRGEYHSIKEAQEKSSKEDRVCGIKVPIMATAPLQSINIKDSSIELEDDEVYTLVVFSENIQDIEDESIMELAVITFQVGEGEIVPESILVEAGKLNTSASFSVSDEDLEAGAAYICLLFEGRITNFVQAIIMAEALHAIPVYASQVPVAIESNDVDITLSSDEVELVAGKEYTLVIFDPMRRIIPEMGIPLFYDFIRYKAVEKNTETAIERVNADKAQKAVKTIENGKVVIIRGDKKYDLSGREL